MNKLENDYTFKYLIQGKEDVIKIWKALIDKEKRIQDLETDVNRLKRILREIKISIQIPTSRDTSDEEED